MAQRYVERVSALRAVAEWAPGALRENDFLDFNERYRAPPPEAAAPV